MRRGILLGARVRGAGEVLCFQADAERIASLTYRTRLEEMHAMQSKQVAACRTSEPFARLSELLGRSTERRLRRLWTEFAAAAADRAIAGHFRAVSFDPGTLGVPKAPKSNGVFIDHAESIDCFRNPEIEVGELTRNLVRILGRKALQLIRDESCALTRVRHALLDATGCRSMSGHRAVWLTYQLSAAWFLPCAVSRRC